MFDDFDYLQSDEFDFNYYDPEDDIDLSVDGFHLDDFELFPPID